MSTRSEIRKKILVVFGTRPEAIKLAPVIQCLQTRQDRFEPVICSTGQHREMLAQALAAFDLRPDYNLDVMKPAQSLEGVTTAVLNGISQLLTDIKPDMLLVQGDTTTAFAAALAAYYRRISIGHVEAGLRTDNKHSPFPEEINRRLVTHLADFHFAPTQTARANLVREGIDEDRILVTGNTVVDALLYMRSRLSKNPSLSKKFVAESLNGINGHRVVLVTAHRRESFGGPLRKVCEAIRTLATERPNIFVVYPVHLNPSVAEPVHRLLGGLSNVRLLEPVDYLCFVALMDRASILLTDSGGLQEEGPALGKPVLVMRDVSERPEAIQAGCASLVGTDPERIVRTVCRLLDEPSAYSQMANSPNPYGDGKAAVRIVDFLEQYGHTHDNNTKLLGSERADRSGIEANFS